MDTDSEPTATAPVPDTYAPFLAAARKTHASLSRVAELVVDLQAQLDAIQQLQAVGGEDPTARARLTAAGEQAESDLRQLLRDAQVLDEASHSLRGWVIEAGWRTEAAPPGRGAASSD